MSPTQSRYVIVTNAGALVGCGLTLIWLLQSLPFAQPAHLLWSVSHLPVWALPLVLNSRGRHLAATLALELGACVVFGGQSLVLGPGYQHHFFFFMFAAAPFLLHPPNQQRLMAAVVALGMTTFVLIEVFKEDITSVLPPYPEPFGSMIPLNILVGVFFSLAAVGAYSRHVELRAQADLQDAQARSEALLLNILPPTIAARLKHSPQTIADSFPDVSVMFADISGFTALAERLSPSEVVNMLNGVFHRFDAIADELGVEKIKTIGDAYMAACGLPTPRPDHAEVLVEMAVRMLAEMAVMPDTAGMALQMRIGINSGPVVAGVIGARKFSFDLWGDVVNTASRMESHGVVGAVHLTETTFQKVRHRFDCQARGSVAIKGKGTMSTYLLVPAGQADTSQRA